MPDQDSKTELQKPGPETVIRAGGWILTLVIVGLWIGAGQLWRRSELASPITVAKYTVEVNFASERDLLNLPEVGPTLAKKILSYRNQHGDFRSLSDFGEVPGVGPQTLKQLAPFLSFTTRSAPVQADTVQADTVQADTVPEVAEDTNEDIILTAQSRERTAP